MKAEHANIILVDEDMGTKYADLSNNEPYVFQALRRFDKVPIPSKSQLRKPHRHKYVEQHIKKENDVYSTVWVCSCGRNLND